MIGSRLKTNRDIHDDITNETLAAESVGAVISMIQTSEHIDNWPPDSLMLVVEFDNGEIWGIMPDQYEWIDHV